MISLKVADYCHDCESFSPECQTFYIDNVPNHTVVCTNFIECRRIKLYLEKKMKEKEK